jgi:hypothetical protein
MAAPVRHGRAGVVRAWVVAAAAPILSARRLFYKGGYGIIGCARCPLCERPPVCGWKNAQPPARPEAGRAQPAPSPGGSGKRSRRQRRSTDIVRVRVPRRSSRCGTGPAGAGCHSAARREDVQNNPAWRRLELLSGTRAEGLELSAPGAPPLLEPTTQRSRNHVPAEANTGGANLGRFHQLPRSTLPLMLSPLWRQEQLEPNGWAGSIVHALDGVLHLRPSFSSPRAIGGGPPKGRSSVCRLGRLAPAKGSSLICCALRGFPIAASKIMIAAAIKTIDDLMVTPPAIRRASR